MWIKGSLRQGRNNRAVASSRVPVTAGRALTEAHLMEGNVEDVGRGRAARRDAEGRCQRRRPGGTRQGPGVSRAEPELHGRGATGGRSCTRGEMRLSQNLGSHLLGSKGCKSMATPIPSHPLKSHGPPIGQLDWKPQGKRAWGSGPWAGPPHACSRAGRHRWAKQGDKRKGQVPSLLC